MVTMSWLRRFLEPLGAIKLDATSRLGMSRFPLKVDGEVGKQSHAVSVSWSSFSGQEGADRLRAMPRAGRSR